MRQIRAISNKVIAKRTNRLIEEHHGIAIPQTAKVISVVCEVLSVGPRVRSGIKVGDMIFKDQYLRPDTEFEVDGQKLLLLNEDEIHCKVEE
ncbi:co-chaperone GroES family protein [bacterium]|nr:co-chaperone GroES family protein [bacterium]